MHCCNGVLKKRVKRVQPLVEVFKKNTLEIINALLKDKRPLSRLCTASTLLVTRRMFQSLLETFDMICGGVVTEWGH